MVGLTLKPQLYVGGVPDFARINRQATFPENFKGKQTLMELLFVTAPKTQLYKNVFEISAESCLFRLERFAWTDFERLRGQASFRLLQKAVCGALNPQKGNGITFGVEDISTRSPMMVSMYGTSAVACSISVFWISGRRGPWSYWSFVLDSCSSISWIQLEK